MGPRWLAVLGCLCALATAGHSAAVPTQDTMVVTRTDDGSWTAFPTASSPVSDTTEEPSPPIKLTEMDVRSEVAMRYAHTAVVTRVRNPAKHAQEATFRVLLPETAFISGFTMILDGKSYKAYVKGKEEAKQIYSDAVSHGYGAAHIATKARDSNHFTVSVNVEPNTTAVFNLTYEELLVRRNKVYNHAVNLHPGELVPKLTVTVHIREAQKITELRVPEVRTGNEIDAAETDAQNSKAVVERGHDDREATITFKPDLEEQKRLRDVYAEKTKESQAHQSSRYYGGYNDEEGGAQPEGVLGQFVVQYDVARPEAGEVLVNDGYFVHFFAPSSLPPLNKHVVFVLDTSGSMMDRKIEQLRQAMQTILSELNAGDYFSIVEFASSVQVHDLVEADQEPAKPYNYYYYEGNKPTVLVPPSPATPDNVAKAKVIVSRLQANGGTNIASALDIAVQLIQKGVGWKQEATTPTVPTTARVTPSNETPKNEEPVAEAVNGTPKDKDVAPKEDQADNKDVAIPDKLEPIIIFLTDGDPTVGDTNPTRIINRLTEKNSGERRASIFSLAFGEDADRKFLRKLSLRNEGFMRHIYEAADAALQLRDFYRQVSSPLLADVDFVYPPDQVKERSVTKHKFRTFYAGSETVVAGRVADGAELAPRVYGVCGTDDLYKRKRYEVSPSVVRGDRDYLPLERLWAYMTIKQLLDERDAVEGHEDKDKDKEDGPEKKALDIALKYEFVTPLTSLVVVKPNATNAVNAESVDKQNGGGSGYGIPLAAHSFASPGLPGPPGSYAYSGFSAQSGAAQTSYSQVQSHQDHDALDSDLPEAENESGDYFNALAAPRRVTSGSGVGYRTSVESLSPIGQSIRLTSNPSNHKSFAHRTGYRQKSRYASARVGVADDIAYYPSTAAASRLPQPFIANEPLPPSPSSTPAPDLPAVYHVQDFPWVLALKAPSMDAISVPVNQTQVTLFLSRADVAPKEASGDAECARATDGAAGLCVYLTRCAAARNITVTDYAETYCTVNTVFAGVCCPSEKVDLKSL